MQFPTHLAKRFVDDIVSSPLNIALVCLIFYFSYKLIKKDADPVEQQRDNKKRKDSSSSQQKAKHLQPMEKRDFTLDELKQYNGKTNTDGRILVSVLGRVFDMSNASQHYGPDGAYSVFAGRDASRALATFSLDEKKFKDEYDDLSDLTPSQMDSVKEWEAQFLEKYDVVGRLLKPDEIQVVRNDLNISKESVSHAADTQPKSDQKPATTNEMHNEEDKKLN